MPRRSPNAVFATLALLCWAPIPGAAAGVPGVATGQAGPDSVGAAGSAQGDSLQVHLLTFGPGSAIWERFGHNALWIHDPEAGTDIAYHYGLFDMSESGFLTRFLQGRMSYSMGAADAVRLIDAYRRVGRETTVQTLALPAGRIRELQAFLEWNLLPENRVYRYDYFRDNCSTRVRDALDGALEGRLREELALRPTPITYRSEAVSLTAEDALLTTGMDLGLGPLADQPLTRWELAFIPMRLRDDIRDLAFVVDGRARPLVTAERHVPALGRADAEVTDPSSPGSRALGLLVTGLLVGGAFAGLGWLSRPEGPITATNTETPTATNAATPTATPTATNTATPTATPTAARTASRWGLAISAALWGLVVGALGLVLLGLWALTDHEFAYANENLLQANPLALGLVVLVPLAVRRGGSPLAWRLAMVLVALAVAGLLLNPLPVTAQANLPIIALMLPVHLGLALALWPWRGGNAA
jgi:hypothetical protein